LFSRHADYFHFFAISLRATPYVYAVFATLDLFDAICRQLAAAITLRHYAADAAEIIDAADCRFHTFFACSAAMLIYMPLRHAAFRCASPPAFHHSYLPLITFIHV